MKETAQAGQWVELEILILNSCDRLDSLPKDTSQIDLVAHVGGRLLQNASIGQTVTIRTILGRVVSGTLSTVEPAVEVTYGEPISELTDIGRELRAIISEGVEDK